MFSKRFPARTIYSPSAAISLEAYLEGWHSDARLRANAAGRLLNAIGKPEVIDTAKDERLGRIFSKRTIHRYDAFKDFLGVEDTIEKIVNYIRHAAEGLQQKRKILYLYGPPGSGKSSIVERLKQLAEREPMYVLAVKSEAGKVIPSPILESPLGLFDREMHGAALEESYKIPRTMLEAQPSRWAARHLEERFKGDMSQFWVLPVQPSMATSVGIAQVVPGSDERPDIGSLVGYAGDDPEFQDYRYAGGLNRTTQGLMEFFEMFKAHKSLLNPLLAAPQDRKYAGAGGVGEIPYQGIIVAHSNEGEWNEFKEKKVNPALLDRIYDIPVPYCLRVSEVAQIYRRHLDESGYKDIPCPPHTLELAALFAVSTRINRDAAYRAELYDGRVTKLDDKGVRLQDAEKARSEEDWREGMCGVSERLMLSLLPQIADTYLDGIALDPVLIEEGLERYLATNTIPTYMEIEKSAAIPDEGGDHNSQAVDIVNTEVHITCCAIVNDLVRRVYVQDVDVYLQQKFDRYVELADAWVEKEDFKDPDSGEIWNRDRQEKELAKLESSVASPLDFRYRVVKSVLRHRASPDKQDTPAWQSLEPDDWLRLQTNILPTKEEMAKVVTFEKRQDAKEEKKRLEFIERFGKLGYTPRQVRRLVDYYNEYC